MRKPITTMLSILVIALAFFSTNEMNAAKRVAVLEDHTGAWCGWCPRGTYIGEQLLEEHGIENFIMVAVHNGDAMATTYQDTLASAIGLQGYPGGSVNRKAFPGMSNAYQGTNTWAQTSELAMAETAPLSVDVEWTLDDAGNLDATVTANVDGSHNKQLAFNLFIIEDGLTGTGNGWDQANSLSGRSGYESYPYYDLPSTIVGFVHDNVLREMMGGVWGETGEFPASVSAGETYTHQFTGNIASKIKDKNNVWVVAVVQEYQPNGAKEIVNAKADGKRIVPRVRPEITSTDEIYHTTDANQTASSEIVITNDSEFEATLNLSIDTDGSVIPSGWNASVTPSTVTVPAGGSANATVSITSGSGGGFAMASVSAQAESTDDFMGMTGSFEVYALASATKVGVFAGTGAAIGGVYNSIASRSEYSGLVAALPASVPVYENYADNFEVAVFDFDYLSGTSALCNNNADGQATRSFIQSILDNGNNVIISSQRQIGYTFYAQNGFSDAMSFYRNYLGIETNSSDPWALTVSTNSQGQITGFTNWTMTGVSSNPLTSGQSNFSTANSTNVQNVVREKIIVSNSNIATPFYTSSDGSVSAVSSETSNGGKAVYLGFTYAALPGNVQTSFMDEVLPWFMGQGGSPRLSVASIVNFGTVSTKTEKDIEVTNDGGAELVIQNITSSNETLFEIVDFETSIPAGGKGTIKITFDPTKAEDDNQKAAVITITSNAGEDVTFNVFGKSDVAGSIDDYLVNNGLFNLNVVPNPVETSSAINYTIGTDAPEQLELRLMDATGNVVANLFNGVATPGTNTMNLEASNFAAGRYFLLATMKGHTSQFPVMIVK